MFLCKSGVQRFNQTDVTLPTFVRLLLLFPCLLFICFFKTTDRMKVYFAVRTSHRLYRVVVGKRKGRPAATLSSVLWALSTFRSRTLIPIISNLFKSSETETVSKALGKWRKKWRSFSHCLFMKLYSLWVDVLRNQLSYQSENQIEQAREVQ